MKRFNGVVDRDHGWRRLMESIGVLRKIPYTKVGILADTERGGLHARDPETGKAADLTVAEIAAVNEFGTEDGHIPSRLFLRSTFDAKQREIELMSAKLLGGIIDGKIDVDKSLDVLGAWFAAQVKNAITAGAEIPPPNAPSTIARKMRPERGNDVHGVRTLVDTGRMVNAIAWAIVRDHAQRQAQYLDGKGTP